MTVRGDAGPGRVPGNQARRLVRGLTRGVWRVRRRAARLLDGQAASPIGARSTGRPPDLDGADPAIEALERRRRRLEREGDLAALERVLYELLVLDPRDVRREALRDVTGSLLVTSPGWIPRVPGPEVRGAAPAAAAADAALCLLDDTSDPPASDPRCHRLLVAARDAGLRVVAMAPPGNRATYPPEREVDGVAYHRADLGPAYARITPPDVALEHEAWFASSLARSAGTGLVHAVLGTRGPASGLVGLALREHLGVALVVDVGDATRLSALPEATRARMLAAEAALLPTADVVIVPSEDARAALSERMSSADDRFDADRIVVVPDDGTEQTLPGAPAALREAYARAIAHRLSSGAQMKGVVP